MTRPVGELENKPLKLRVERGVSATSRQQRDRGPLPCGNIRRPRNRDEHRGARARDTSPRRLQGLESGGPVTPATSGADPDLLHQVTMADVLAQHAAHTAQLACVCGADRYTYAELDDRTNRLANALSDLGVGHGDRILWLAQNCHRLLESMLAAAKLGAVMCPVNWRQSADELAFVIRTALRQLSCGSRTRSEKPSPKARELAESIERRKAHWVQHDGARSTARL